MHPPRYQLVTKLSDAIQDKGLVQQKSIAHWNRTCKNERVILPFWIAHMMVQMFRDLLARVPFQPFRMVMSSGKAYEVRHPEMALLTRSDLLAGIDQSDEGIPADFRICSLLHVVTVEPLTHAPSEPE
jgi:hypothetical protein